MDGSPIFLILTVGSEPGIWFGAKGTAGCKAESKRKTGF